MEGEIGKVETPDRREGHAEENRGDGTHDRDGIPNPEPGGSAHGGRLTRDR